MQQAVLSALAGGLVGVAKACYDIMPNSACAPLNNWCSGDRAAGYMDGIQCGGYDVVSNKFDIPNSLNTHALSGKYDYDHNPPMKDCWDVYYCYFKLDPDGYAYCSRAAYHDSYPEPDNSLAGAVCP